jgi:hypothetical protein
VAANPNPNPNVALKPLRDGAKIPRHPHGPETRIRTKPFQLQRWVCRVLEKLLMGGTSGFLDAERQCVISLPKFLRAQ